MSSKPTAETLFNSLSSSQRWELGDALVMGTARSLLMEWGVERSILTSSFLNKLDSLRMTWEDTR